MRRAPLRLPDFWFPFFAGSGLLLSLATRWPLCAWLAAFSFGLIAARLLGLVEAVVEKPGSGESGFTWRHHRLLELLSLALLPIVLALVMSIDGPIPIEPLTVIGALGVLVLAVFALGALRRLWKINRRRD